MAVRSAGCIPDASVHTSTMKSFVSYLFDYTRTAHSPSCTELYIYILIVHSLVGLQADLNSRLSAFRLWLLLFLWRGVRGDSAGWDGVSTISNLKRFFARVCAQRRVVHCCVAARPLQFCWWPLPDPLLVLRLRRVPVLLGSHEVPHRRMLPGQEPVWFMHVWNNISTNLRLYVKISTQNFNCSL